MKITLHHNAAISGCSIPRSDKEKDNGEPAKDQVDKHDGTAHDKPGSEVEII